MKRRETVCWMWEDATGRLQFSKAHLLDDNGDPLCGYRPVWPGDWEEGTMSRKGDCKRCQKAADKIEAALERLED